LTSASAIALLLASPLAHASDHYFVEELEGDRVVLVTDGKTLTPHPAKQGEELHVWDVIRTTKRSAAKLRYPDGSVVLVGRDTKFAIQPKGQGETQYNQLDWGQVRAQVTPEKPDPKAKPGTEIKKPPRFVIRTKTAVMGVRGTDFVAGFDPGTAQSSLHTITGTVDIASDESRVMSWQGTPVSASHSASVDTGSSSPSVQPFKAEEYKQQIQADQPELVKPADLPSGQAPPPPDPAAAAAMAATLAHSPEAPEGEEPRLSLLSFRVGSLSIVQDSKLAFTSLGLSWNPVVRVWSIFAVRGHAGVSRIKNADTGEKFNIAKLALLADVEIPFNLHVEAGGGQERWMTDSQGTQTAACLLGNLVWRFAPGKWLDSIYVGAAKYLVSDDGDGGAPVEVQAGVGLRF
jgi:hypothetical protein